MNKTSLITQLVSWALSSLLASEITEQKWEEQTSWWISMEYKQSMGIQAISQICYITLNEKCCLLYKFVTRSIVLLWEFVLFLTKGIGNFIPFFSLQVYCLEGGATLSPRLVLNCKLILTSYALLDISD